MIYASSRRTVMDGEVVTFATAFKEKPGIFGRAAYEAIGPFEVSASRDAVIVHRATISSADSMDRLVEALRLAYAAMERLEGRYGQPFLYPSDPTPIDAPKERQP